MKKFAVLILAAGLVLGGSAVAYAGGSDAHTPYTVDVNGITLPAGDTFPDGGHVNVKSNQGDRGIHFESLNNQPSGQWIGKSFLPWEAFGFDISDLCVTWVQISLYNEHFGEGGQSPIGNGCEIWPTPTASPTSSPTPTQTPSPTPSATSTPTETSTPSPEPTSSNEPSPSPTSNPEDGPTSTPSAAPTTVIPPESPTSSTSTMTKLPDTGGNYDWAIWSIVGVMATVLGTAFLMMRPRKVK